MTELMKRYESELANEGLGELKRISDIAIRILDKQVEILQAENSQLKAQLTWHPVSEKPKEGQIVFAMIPTGWVVAQYLNGKFYIDDGFTYGDYIEGVVKWLPIPPQGDKS